MRNGTDYISLLKNEMTAVTGCTEPVAVAYAAALARNEIAGYEIERIYVLASGNIIKNAMAVLIPGTEEHGVEIAAALGAVAGNPEKKLALLEDITTEQVLRAKSLCWESVRVSTASALPPLYVDITVIGGGHSGRAVLQNYHDCLVLLERDGKLQMENNTDGAAEAGRSISTRDIEDIFDFVSNVDIGQLDIIQQGITLNMKISREGLAGKYGLCVGKTLHEENHRESLITYAVALAAAGSDARMAGAPYAVMSNSGSGNQGICATVPVAAIAEKLGADRDTLIRGVALSNLTAIHVKKSIGRLSPLCGAVAAGIGAGAGIVYIMGGGIKEIKASVQNMLGNVTGMICDGAKAGCAMKVSTCVFAAAQSALIAMKGNVVQSIEGIIEADVERTIDNISRISGEGMPEMDPLLLSIIINKK